MRTKTQTTPNETDQARGFYQNLAIKEQLQHEGNARTEKLKAHYASIDSMDRHAKMTVLGHPGVNPFLLKDPADSINVMLNKWADPKHGVANDAVLSNYSEEKKAELAGKYYDMFLAPFYAAQFKNSGIKPLDRELWIKQAFKEATQFKLANAYDNDVLHDVKHGWNNAVPALARFGETFYNVFTNFFSKPQERTDMTAEQFAAIKASSPASFTDARNPDSAVNKGSRIQQENHQFWADALPVKGGWWAQSTSTIADQVGHLPIYVAIAAAPSVGAETLTARLGLSTAGKLATRYLMAGAEGTAYRVATCPKGDKLNAWQDTLGFIIGSMLFDVGGAGLGKLARMGKTTRQTLLDAVRTSQGEDSEMFKALKARQDEYMLGAQGRRLANAQEIYEGHKLQTANGLAAGGLPIMGRIYNDALRHIENMETVEGGKWTRAQVKEYEKKLLAEDPARWSQVIGAANYMRMLMPEGVKLSGLSENDPIVRNMYQKVSQLVVEAAAEMNQHVPDLAEHEASDGIAEVLKNGSAKPTLDFYKQQVIKDATESGAIKMMTPEKIVKAAQKAFSDAVQKAQKLAASRLARNQFREEADVIAAMKKQSPVTAPKDLAARRAEAIAQGKSRDTRPFFSLKSRSGRTPGNEWVSLSPSYSVYLKDKAKAAGVSTNFNNKEFSEWLANFYDGLDEKDFALHLEDNFYPEPLKKAGVWFEHQSAAAQGPEHPNFLAFMYNYKEHMPAEMQRELEERLVGTAKFQEAFQRGAKTQELLDFYSLGMYNHVDDFLGSGRWPQESNIFRSTFSMVRGTTRYQAKLLKEKMGQEVKNLEESLAIAPKAQQAAVTQLKSLQRKRMAAFNNAYDEDPNSRKAVMELNELITQEITKYKLYDRWQF